MNELDSLRQEAETLKNAIRVSVEYILQKKNSFFFFSSLKLWICARIYDRESFCSISKNLHNCFPFIERVLCQWMIHVNNTVHIIITLWMSYLHQSKQKINVLMMHDSITKYVHIINQQSVCCYWRDCIVDINHVQHIYTRHTFVCLLTVFFCLFNYNLYLTEPYSI